MTHDTHNNGNSEKDQTIISFKSSFWLIVIIAGLFVASLNFISAMSGGHEEAAGGHGAHTEAAGHGGHEAKEHKAEGHEAAAPAASEAAHEGEHKTEEHKAESHSEGH